MAKWHERTAWQMQQIGQRSEFKDTLSTFRTQVSQWADTTVGQQQTATSLFDVGGYSLRATAANGEITKVEIAE